MKPPRIFSAPLLAAPTGLLAAVADWGGKGVYSVLDQGLYSGANFTFSVLLARWLPPVEYGAYALAFAVFLIFHQLHQSVITDPMGVLGPANHSRALREYILTQLKMHFLLTVPFGLIVGLGSLALSSRLTGDTLVFITNLGLMILLLPLALLPWFLRRAFYVLQRPRISALGSLVYALSLILALLFLRSMDILNSRVAILAMGVAALVGGCVLYWRLLSVQEPHSSLRFGAIFTDNWRYARWLVAAALFMVLAAQMQILMAGRLLGIVPAGVIDVTQTFSQPMILTIGAITALVTPVLSRDFATGGAIALRRKVAVMSWCLCLGALVFAGMLYVLRAPLELLLYNGKYSAYLRLIPLFGCVPVLLALYWGPAAGLLAAQRPQAILLVSVVWLPASAIAGYICIRTWGLQGAAFGSLIGYAVIAAICWVLYRRWLAGGIHAL